MNTHPNSEEWMSFLYGETPPQRTGELDAHLRQCGDCRKRVAHWRMSMSALDAWSMPAPSRSPRRLAAVAGWAAAAAIVLSVGFAVGRISVSPSARIQQLELSLRAEMEAALAASRTELTAALEKRDAELAGKVQKVAGEAASREAEQLLAKFAGALDEQRVADQDVYVAALRNLEERRATDFANLRKDLDTLAVNADDGLSRTQEQLVELASLTHGLAK